MHELGLTQALFDLAMRHARSAGAGRITALEVRVGALSGIVPDSVSFYFDMIAQDTIAAGAALRYEIVPPIARCRQCGRETRLAGGENFSPYDWFEQFNALTCPNCGGQEFELLGGREFALASIDIE